MFKKDKIIAKRAIELEIWLFKNSTINITDDEMLKLLEIKGFNKEESKYLVNAYHIPISDLREQLTIYDTTVPHMDELKFISNLQTKYNVDENTIIKRIRYIRLIDKYLRKKTNVIYPETEMLVNNKEKDKLKSRKKLHL